MFDWDAKQLKVLRSIKIEVKSDLQALDEALFQLNQIYQDSIPVKDWLQCRLALAEGFTNAVRHAHKDLPKDTPIRIEVLLNQTSMEIEIWDRGPAFNLHSFIAETAKKHPDWPASGRGIPILNKISSRLDYYRTGERNCLVIVKEFNRLPWTKLLDWTIYSLMIVSSITLLSSEKSLLTTVFSIMLLSSGKLCWGKALSTTIVSL